MITTSRKCLPAVAVGLLLSACGGGSSEPVGTPIAATLTVTAATNSSLNGVYATNTVSLGTVQKINPVGNEPEVCSFRFSGLVGPGGTMDGPAPLRHTPRISGSSKAMACVRPGTSEARTG